MLAKIWADLPVERQRAIVAAVFDHILILPARGRTAPERVAFSDDSEPVEALPQPDPEPQRSDAVWLDAGQTAHRLGIGGAALRSLVRHGDLAGYRIGTTRRYRESDIEEFLDNAKITPTPLGVSPAQP